MKPQYKIDQFVMFKGQSGHEETGIINGVLTEKEGYSYRMVDTDMLGFVPERNIIQAYRPVLQRKAKARTTKTSARANKKNTNSEQRTDA